MAFRRLQRQQCAPPIFLATLLLVPMWHVYAQVSPTALVASYSFDEATGTVAADASGNGTTAVIQGASWSANGRYGPGLFFDGASSHVDLGNPSLLQITGSMTLSAWVYATAYPPDDGQILARSTDASGWQLKTTPDTGSRTFGIAVSPDGATLTQRFSRTIVELNTWYHVAGVYDSASQTLDIYVNGVLDNGLLSGTVPASQVVPNVNATVGMRSGGYYFKGVIDEVRAYNVPLTAAQIQADLATPIRGNLPSDTTAPSVPANLSATTVSDLQVTLSWTASSDNVAVAGYRVYRDGMLVATTAAPVYNDSGLAPFTTYSYTVAAFDAADNQSAQSDPPLSVTTAAEPPPPPPLPTGLVAAYSFNEGMGATAHDSSDNGNGGTIANAVWTTGKYGTALSFNGASSYVDLGSASSAGSMTVSAWIYATGHPGDDGQIVARSTDTSGWQLKTTPDTGRRTFGFAISPDGGSLTQRYSNTVVSLNTWYYLTGVYNADARTLDIYVDGMPDNGALSGVVPASQLIPNVNATVGMRSGGYYFLGAIDEVRLYNMALTAAQIQADMATPIGGSVATDTIAPSTPANLSATARSASQIDLAWAPSIDNVAVANYQVYRNGTLIATTAQTTYSDTGLSGSTTYTYTVAAVDAAGNASAPSDAATATTSTETLDVTPPSVPIGVNSSGIGANRATISWNASTDNIAVTGYRVRRNDVLVATATQTIYNDATLAPSTTYFYTVSAFDAVGNESAPSDPPLSVTTLTGPAGPVYPLSISANRRYLVDRNNQPFLMLGDSPQPLFVNVSKDEASFYFANRKAAGFNTVWINLLCNYGTSGNVDGTTYDGVGPFTAPNDLSTPNEEYFARADEMIDLAAQYGLLVLLDPIETIGWLDALRNNGLQNAHDYGRYVGSRYSRFDNIIWMSGNDFQTWRDTTDDALARAVATGIAETDPRHIQTVELDYFVSNSLDDSSWAPLISLNAAYTYYATYAEVLEAYNNPNIMPVFMVEASYEFENYYQGPITLRRQEYWTMLSGATGQLYGSYFTWQLQPGWQAELNTTGTAQIAYVKALFELRRWYDLIPDQDHALVTAGYGTYSSDAGVNESDYVTAAATADGTLAIAYLPTSRTVTVQMSKFAGSVTAQWYDPASGSYLAVASSPFANSGAQQFSPPGPNSDGDGDWVLLLEVN